MSSSQTNPVEKCPAKKLAGSEPFAPKIEIRPTSDLKPNPRNARTHNRKQVHAIESSIKKFGFTNPILIASDRTIVAGHGRYEAAKHLGLAEVPVVRLDHLSPDEIRAT